MKKGRSTKKSIKKKKKVWNAIPIEDFQLEISVSIFWAATPSNFIIYILLNKIKCVALFSHLIIMRLSVFANKRRRCSIPCAFVKAKYRLEFVGWGYSGTNVYHLGGSSSGDTSRGPSCSPDNIVKMSISICEVTTRFFNLKI